LDLPRSAILEALSAHELTIARSAYEAIDAYTGGYDLLLLDHDMRGIWGESEDYQNTGFQFVKWLTAQGHKPVPTILHSHFPEGRRRMRAVLELHGFDCREIPFSLEYVKYLRSSVGFSNWQSAINADIEVE
jgi:CheY-like chemotaxis protein